jgi:hypothetical protein
MRKVKIVDIYNEYSLPEQLQDHMLYVAAFAKLIINNWNGPEINEELVIKCLLLHDIGNVVKSDYRKYLPLEKPDLNYWNSVKEGFIVKYGTDDHLVTYNILTELRLNEEIKWITLNKIFVQNEVTSSSKNYNLKVCAYTDQRVSPSGIVSLKERFDELKERNKDNPYASINHPRVDKFIESAFEIERQILKYCTIKEDTLAEDIKEITKKLKNYEIEAK